MDLLDPDAPCNRNQPPSSQSQPSTTRSANQMGAKRTSARTSRRSVGSGKTLSRPPLICCRSMPPAPALPTLIRSMTRVGDLKSADPAAWGGFSGRNGVGLYLPQGMAVGFADPTRWGGSGGRVVYGTTWKTGCLGASAANAASGASGATIEIGPGDGDPFHVGFEDRCGCLRRKFLHPHPLGAPAAAQLHLPGSPGVAHPPHRAIGSDQPALSFLLDQGDRVEWGLPLRRPGTVSSIVVRGARPRRSNLRIRMLAKRRSGVRR